MLSGPATALALPAYQATLLPSGFVGQDINDAGQIVGNTRESKAWIWSESGIVNLSLVIPGVQAFAVNDKSQVAGTAGNFPGETSRPIFYDGAMMTGINIFGGDQGDALALNDKGTVVGNAALAPPPDSPYSARQPFVYRDGILSELRTSKAMVYSAGVVKCPCTHSMRSAL